MENSVNMTMAQLEHRIRTWVSQVGREHPEAFGCNVPCELVSCDPEKMETLFRFRTIPEMGNPWGVTHGGMLALLLDWAMGITSRTILDYNHTPTVDMQIQYLKPAPLNSDLYIRANIHSRGSRVAFLTAKAWTESESKPLTMASGVYYLREPHLKLEDSGS